ncbi:hypothetical protein JCM10213v2_004419 [Rhodosporidiobolus nylandii]
MMDEDEPQFSSVMGNGGTAQRARSVAKAADRTPKKQEDASRPQPPPTPPPSTRRRTTSTTSSLDAPASPSSPKKVLVKLAGRVYRQPEEGDLRSRAHFEADLLLNEPLETVEDLEQERRLEKRRRIEQEMRREQLLEAAQASPSRGSTKGKGRVLTFDSSGEDRQPQAKKPFSSGLCGTPTRSPSTLTRPSTPPPQLTLQPKPPTSPSPSLGLPIAFHSSPRASTSTALPSLPAPLAALLSLHSAVERALILHLSTAGSSIASTSSEVDATTGEAVVRMTNLIDLPTLSKMLESSGKRFGEDELRRLVWLWEGCGGLVSDGSRTRSEEEAGGLGFLVTRARTSSAAGARISGTYGLGISVGVKTNPQLPKFELVSPGRRSQQVAPPSPSSVGKGREGMSIVALWTQGKEQRQTEVSRRLRLLANEKEVKKEQAADVEADDIVTFDWTTSAASQPSAILASIPRASLPLLNAAVPAIPSTSTPSPKKPSFTAASTTLPASTLAVASPEKFVSALLQGKPIKAKAGKAADRAAALRERIQAKQDAQKQSAYHASLSALSTGESSPTKRSLKRHAGKDDDEDAVALEQEYVPRSELLKRNAMLSRLGSVSDVVVMRCGARPTRFDEVCSAVANSPLLAIGFDEADQSLTFLADRFPEFCYTKMSGQERWMCLRGGAKALDVKEKVREELARVAELMKAK